MLFLSETHELSKCLIVDISEEWPASATDEPPAAVFLFADDLSGLSFWSTYSAREFLRCIEPRGLLKTDDTDFKNHESSDLLDGRSVRVGSFGKCSSRKRVDPVELLLGR